MTAYQRTVFYYETDKMGITHHSNYVRWMEEARVHFLKQSGTPLTALEAEGITSPVAGIDVRYLRPTVFGQEIIVETTLTKYNGVKLEFSYLMKDAATGTPVAQGTSRHGFLYEGTVCNVRKLLPELHEELLKHVEAGNG